MIVSTNSWNLPDSTRFLCACQDLRFRGHDLRMHVGNIPFRRESEKGSSMSASTPGDLPQETVAALAEASTDLIQFGTLSNYSDIFALDRAGSGRTINTAESSIDNRLANDRNRQLASMAIVRSVAELHPDAFNANIAAALSDPSLDPDTKKNFDKALGVSGGNYAVVALEECNRVEAGLRGRTSGSSGNDGSAQPPVSGGDDSLGCGMIAIGSMAGGAACVIGCVPCCPAGAIGGLIFLGLCA